MSSSAFDSTLELALVPSGRALRYLLLLHSLPLAVLVFLQPGWQEMALAGLVALSWWRLRRHAVFGYGPRALTRLIWHADGHWTAQRTDGWRREAWLDETSFLHRRLLVLRLRDADGRIHTRALLGDEAAEEPLRRLRARLFSAAFPAAPS